MAYNRAFASMLYLLWVGGCWAVVFGDGWMTGFGGGRTSRPAHPILEQGATVVFLIWVVAVSILPLISLWMRSRILVAISGGIMLPLIVIGVLMLTIPFLGIPFLGTLVLWYLAAFPWWRYLKEE